MSLWNQEREAYVIWFAVIGWAGGSLVAVVGSRVKTICLEWYGISKCRGRGLHFFSAHPNDALVFKRREHTLIWRGYNYWGNLKISPSRENICERKESIFYINVLYAQLFNIQYTRIMKWWGMVIHSIAPRLKKHVYLGYLRKVFEPSVIQWQATQSCWCITRIPLFYSSSYFTALCAEE